MGVYINMEMPTSCDDCRLNNGISCYAVPEYTEDGVVGRTDDRPDWCPLVPVPPHGDLIDRDALMKILSKVIDINASIEQRNEATDQERRCLWWFEQQIGIAPTIIPASEDGVK